MKETKNMKKYNILKEHGYNTLDTLDTNKTIKLIHTNAFFNYERFMTILLSLFMIVLTGVFFLFLFPLSYEELLTLYSWGEIKINFLVIGIAFGFFTFALLNTIDLWHYFKSLKRIRKSIKKRIKQELEFLERYDKGLEKE